eukprot:c19563_g1_i2.p1 GENE.c19563_g1_i2~~c19563_g1_i2.p1  ORF type:complete len:346 (-),score=99.48 c19563_g1_i2:1063-2100(-)
MSDEQGEHVDGHILEKFEIKKRIGKGAYGYVWRVVEKKTGQVFALKKIFDAFQNSTDAQRTFREVKFLQQLKDHENIVKLFDIYKADNDKDLYLVFEFMDTDLYAVIKANILEVVHQHYVIYQLVKSLKYLHSAGVIHRDIKPSNLLLNNECLLKVCDFGLARYVKSEDNPILTDYVATRWYRAPEILVGSTNYTTAVDMWSVGCIVGELILKRPLFTGSSTMNQLEIIVELLGYPSQQEIESIQSPFAATMLASVKRKATPSWADRFPGVDPQALDLMQKLLAYDPSKRLSAEECLKHPYLEEFHDEEDEPACTIQLSMDIDDNSRGSVDDYRKRLYNEIASKK